MPKILLVEDDNNLREIFDMRLQAEGYETVAAGDGEEALVVAVKEKPDLIIADVMMPKLSGFEMLETLRSSPDVGKVKVIMMTALGQAEDRARGEKLGVVKYLVKSQVTLEDFVRVVREVLPIDGASTEVASTTPDSSKEEPTKLESENPMPEDNQAPATDPAAVPAPDTGVPSVNPISDPAPAAPAEPAVDSGVSGDPSAAAQTTAQEETAVADQINEFVANAPAVTPVADSAPAESDASSPVEAPEGIGSVSEEPAVVPAEGAEPAADAPAEESPTPPTQPS